MVGGPGVKPAGTGTRTGFSEQNAGNFIDITKVSGQFWDDLFDKKFWKKPCTFAGCYS